MRNVVYSAICIFGLLGACAPTNDSRSYMYEGAEANAPDQYNPSSVSPREEARYGINFGADPDFDEMDTDALAEPTDVVATEREYAYEDTLNRQYVQEGFEEGVSCEVYSVFPEEEKVQALSPESDDLEPVYSEDRRIIIRKEAKDPEEKEITIDREAEVRIDTDSETEVQIDTE